MHSRKRLYCSGQRIRKPYFISGYKLYFYGRSTQSSPAYITASSHVPRVNAQASAGIFAVLGPDYERVLGGRALSMTVSARKNRAYALDEFDMGYFTAGAGDSGWKTRKLTDVWRDYVLYFTPAPSQE